MATSLAVDFKKPSIVLITGASRGIGQEIAVEFSKHLNENSKFVLFARDLSKLEETKKKINEINPSIAVLNFSIDLSKPNFEKYVEILEEVLQNIRDSTIESAYIFHNAGHVGVLEEASQLVDLNVWRTYYDLNLFSVILLNNAFLQKFSGIVSKIIVVNITSLLGRQPFSSFSMYGSGKAAREMYFKILATEQPNLIVLNYSPGPVLTDMFNSICDTATAVELRRNFQEIRDKSVLTTNQTVSKLLTLLENGNYSSGDTVDYFDRT
ncbi:hypothetical protein ABEB36_008575 [Hypothenemus hampei]|uniref:Sepiapterin reductase n=1 Tax=Hypothenemus hampei TaxID=57062 RepID=A0ABD1EPK4_HYPHA